MNTRTKTILAFIAAALALFVIAFDLVGGPGTLLDKYNPNANNAIGPALNQPVGTTEGDLPARGSGEIVKVTLEYVVDGDTIMVLMDDGTPHYVRLIGIDTPEMRKNEEEAEGEVVTEVGAAEAKEYLQSHLQYRQTLWLEYDMEAYDKYGRDLAYVWVVGPAETEDFAVHTLNGIMALSGWAKQLTIAPNTKYQALIEEIISQAREAGRGLWHNL